MERATAGAPGEDTAEGDCLPGVHAVSPIAGSCYGFWLGQCAGVPPVGRVVKGLVKAWMS